MEKMAEYVMKGDEKGKNGKACIKCCEHYNAGISK